MAEYSPIENTRRPILYICRHYVPASTAAGIRADHFVGALLGRGLNVVVMTLGQKPCIENPSSQLTIYRMGENGELSTEISRVKINNTHWSLPKVLPGPDADRRCARGFQQLGQWLIDKYHPRLVVVTGPPFYLMVVGQVLAGQNELELFLEFRDAWFSGMYWPYRNRWRRTSARRWERRCIEKADKIITVTEAHRQILIEKYGKDVEQKRQRFDMVSKPRGLNYQSTRRIVLLSFIRDSCAVLTSFRKAVCPDNCISSLT